MNEPLSASQRDMHQRILENRLLEFCANIHDQCNAAPTLPADLVRAMIQSIEEAKAEQAKFEDVAGLETLTPLHFELSAVLDKFHDHLTTRLAEAEAAIRQ